MAIPWKLMSRAEKDSCNAYKREWRRRNPPTSEERSENVRKSTGWRMKNPGLEQTPEQREKRKKYIREWRKSAEQKKKAISYAREWRSNHRAQVNRDAIERRAKSATQYESGAKKRANKHNVMPRWVDRKAISVFYSEAKRMTNETGIAHVVDHKYPICGKGFNGLHVPWNLQILTRTQNARKYNTVPPEALRPIVNGFSVFAGVPA